MKLTWYKWTWENGMITYGRGYDRTEMASMVKQNGKLISKEKAW